MTSEQGRRRAIAGRLHANCASIAASVTDEFLERHPDWLDRFPQARERGEEDAGFHLEFLAGAILADEASAFADYARWTCRMLSARGIAPEFLSENLEQVGRAAAAVLDAPDRAIVERFTEEGVAAVEQAQAPPGDESEPREDHSDDQTRTARSLYLQSVLSGNRRAAVTVALEAVRSGMSVPNVYLEILQPVQYEIGQMWERNEVTVAKEHMATAITQYVVASLYPHLEIPDASRGNAIVTGVRGELHQLGANMVSDVLEADGWNARFLGTQLPHASVLEAIAEHEPLLVGISATVLSSLQGVVELIDETRATFGSDVRILVGGGAFRANPGSWKSVGADGYGRDLRDAVRVADELVPRGS